LGKSGLRIGWPIPDTYHSQLGAVSTENGAIISILYKLPEMQRTEIFFSLTPAFSVLFLENCDHPTDVKVNFLLGELKVFDRPDVFAAELYSSLCLNQALEWDSSFFRELR
jgi:hypothetical protein